MSNQNDSTNIGKAKSRENPYFRDANRAPQELGDILRAMPKHLPRQGPIDQDTYDLAKAAAQHASNSIHAVLCGMETVGRFIFSVATSNDTGFDASDFADAGYLIRYLAVQAQYLVETEGEFTEFVAKEDARRQQEGGVK